MPATFQPIPISFPKDLRTCDVDRVSPSKQVVADLIYARSAETAGGTAVGMFLNTLA